MSSQNYIINILNLKENYYYEEKIKGITHKIFEAYLSYKPTCCPKCGIIFDNKFEKHGFITSLKYKNYDLLNNTLHNHSNNISSYMKTSIKTLLEFLPYIKNTFNNNYHNGYIEGNNNFIKVIKRIAFGFRSFTRFKARIMICKGLLKIKKIANA